MATAGRIACAGSLTQVRRTGERPVRPVDQGVIDGFREQAKKRYPNRQAALFAIRCDCRFGQPAVCGRPALRDRTRQPGQGDGRIEGAGARVLRRARDAPGSGHGRAGAATSREGCRHRDSALEQWGMAMGILAVFDMAGVDVGVNVHRSNADKYPPDPTYYQADFALHAAGRLGQKNGKGYYRYEGRNRLDDPEAIEILRQRSRELAVPQREHSEQEIVERCLYPLMNEGFRILEEGVALRASDVDVVWTAGYGFPRYRGGPMFHADTIGLKTLCEGMLKYRAEFGPMHWEPAPLLAQLAREGKSLVDWARAQR